MSEPLFTVVVPTYRRPALLAEALASIRAQTVDDFECIVVDDASGEPVELPDDGRFRLLRRSEGGSQSGALNTGIDDARGRYVTFLDDDDLYTPDRLELALEGLRGGPFTICWSKFLDGADTISGQVFDGDASHTILNRTTPHLGTVATQRELLLKFDERFQASADLDWWLRMTSRAPLTTVRKVGLLIRRHSGPRGRNSVEARLASSRLLLDKHAGYFAQHPKARAFRYKRAGLMAQQIGDHRAARRFFLRSLPVTLDPATVRHVARSLRRSTPRPRPEEAGGHERQASGT